MTEIKTNGKLFYRSLHLTVIPDRLLALNKLKGDPFSDLLVESAQQKQNEKHHKYLYIRHFLYKLTKSISIQKNTIKILDLRDFLYKIKFMDILQKKYRWIELSDDVKRQYINAESLFTALEEAKKEAAQVRGGMHWKKQQGYEYLIRTSVKNSQKSLGPRSKETEEIYTNFVKRKARVEDRVNSLKKELTLHQRMNNALRVGRAPQLLVDLLNHLEASGLAQHFTVVGTHALYAYEATAGTRFASTEALATNDIDLLWDTQKRIKFFAHMKILKSSMLNLLRKVDPTFQIREHQRYTAVNDKGFEVDIIRREAKNIDPNPLRLTDADEEIIAIQAPNADKLINAPRFSSMIVSASGHMARMNTVSPVNFVEFKRWLGNLDNRDPLKKSRDLLQADLVEELVANYLPHLL